MQILGSRTSPFVRKVRVFAIERGVPLEFVEEDPWKKSSKLLGLNPLGKVPVLIMDDGRIFFDSFAVIQILDEIGPADGRMLPAHGSAAWDMMKWHALAHGLIEAVVGRLLETRRPQAFQMEERLKQEEDRFASTLRAIEADFGKLPTSSPDRPGFAQLMLAVALRYADFRHPHPWRPGHPRLTALVEGLAVRPSFVQTDPPG